MKLLTGRMNAISYIIENKIVTQMLRNIEIQFPSNSILAIIIYKNIQKGGNFMDVLIKGNAQISKLLNEWYKEIRSRNIDNAHCLKEEINSIIHNNEADSNLLLYYHLLDFGYKYLVDNLSISKIALIKLNPLIFPQITFYLTTTIL